MLNYRRISILGLFVFAASLVGCGSNDQSVVDAQDAAPADGSKSEGGPSHGGGDAAVAPLGSGDVTGTGGFPVVTAKWSDPGPFQTRPRIEILLSDDASCHRPNCSNYHQLMLRLSGPPGGSLGPGIYSSSVTDAGGIVGDLIARQGYGQVEMNGCTFGEQPSPRGTVTVDTLTATEVTGTFDVDITTSMGPPIAHLTGHFDALTCS